ncbi:MAG TPA: hypothetical protein VG819_06180 [Rhizomicrobium sp.]|jgi:hypothetical protein|nr:hypothetical protein [Rhizomicrobium sp.]
MNKLLLPAAAAAAVVLSTAAYAKTASISFDGLCDGMDISVDKTNQTALETGNGCDEGAHFGAATVGKIKDRGKVLTFGVNLSGKGGGAYQYIYVIDYPFVTGGSWSNFYTTDGKTLSRINSGTYTVGAPARQGGRSSTSPR